MKLVVVGSANIDLVTRVPRTPKPGESLIGHSFATVTGGKGANQAVAAGRLGADVTFIGCVGDDAFGRQQAESLSSAGVDVSRMKVHPTEPTGTAVILVADEGQNSIVVTPSANYQLTADHVSAAEDVIAAADVLLVQLEIPIEGTAAALEMAREHDVVSILDAGPAQAVPPEVVSLASIVSPNETEAETMTGVHVDSVAAARVAATALLDMGAACAVMKLGAMGCLHVADEELHAPAFAVDPVDTTAAGDAFTAALGVAWNEGDVAGALRFANAAGALATTVAGAQPSAPARDQVEVFLARANVSSD